MERMATFARASCIHPPPPRAPASSAARCPEMMLLLASLTSGYTLRAAVRPAAAARSVAARCDADRCYYGRVDADGNVLKGVAEVGS
eukprot:scaffold4712_cov51-Phaeocystis_antarctica.AAC.2